VHPRARPHLLGHSGLRHRLELRPRARMHPRLGRVLRMRRSNLLRELDLPGSPIPAPRRVPGGGRARGLRKPERRWNRAARDRSTEDAGAESPRRRPCPGDLDGAASTASVPHERRLPAGPGVSGTAGLWRRRTVAVRTAGARVRPRHPGFLRMRRSRFPGEHVLPRPPVPAPGFVRDRPTDRAEWRGRALSRWDAVPHRALADLR